MDKSMYKSRPQYGNINCQILSLTDESMYMSKPSDHLCSLSESDSQMIVTTHDFRTYILTILNITNIVYVCGENCESSWAQISL